MSDSPPAVKYERIKFLVIALKNSVEIYAWAPKPYHKFMAFKVSQGERWGHVRFTDINDKDGRKKSEKKTLLSLSGQKISSDKIKNCVWMLFLFLFCVKKFQPLIEIV